MRLLAIAGALVIACAASAVLAAPPPAAAYGRLPVIDAALSPDGTKVALGQAVGDVGVVRVIDLNGAELLSARMQDRQTLRALDFVDDRTLTFRFSRTFTKEEAAPLGIRFTGPDKLITYWRASAVSLDSKQPRLLLENYNNFLDADISSVIAPIEGDPGFARMVGFVTPGQASQGVGGLAAMSVGNERFQTVVYRVDLATGRGRPVEEHNGRINQILLDARGATVAHTESAPLSNTWRIVSHVGRTERPVAEQRRTRYGAPPVLGLLPDGRASYIEYDARGFAVLFAIDLRTGALETLFASDKVDVEYAMRDPWTRQVVGVGYTDDAPRQKFFDPALETVRSALAARFGARHVILRSWSRDRSIFLLHAEATGKGAWYLFDAAAGRLRLITQDYPDVPDDQLGDMLAITYPARDGTPIPAVLTMPRGAEPRNLPLVVLVHGGPSGRDDMRFDWWTQFLASRGYAVLQPNFRGSDGYGRAWEDAGLKQWGGRMQTDVEDGAAALVRSGRVDPARICIAGASYGGYAALAGATLTPERFACAISVNGVADPLTFLENRIRAYGGASATADYWRLSIGDPGEDRDRILAASPFHNAAAARAPVLLLHGQEDSTVPIEQSRRMAQALERAGKSVRFVELTGDDHYLSAGSTRTRMLEEIDAFLKPVLAPR